MDRSRHTVTKCLSAGKTHGAINNKMFRRLGYMNDQLYEVEVVNSEIELEGLIIVGFFILQYAKSRKVELFHNFFNVAKFEELEMGTDSLYLELSGCDLYDCIGPAMNEVWNSLRSGDCTDEFAVNSATTCFTRTRCVKHKKHQRQPGVYKEECRCTERICLCSKTYCCYNSQSNKFEFSSKSLNGRTLVTSRVPQESILGPLFFIAYVNKLSEVKPHGWFFVYAKDFQISLIDLERSRKSTH